MSLKASDNVWDWLGGGLYFWEQNPGRALEYAEECAAGKQKNKVQIKTPFVIGAIIELGNCLNLLDAKSGSIVRKAYNALSEVHLKAQAQMPLNRGARRELDCAVIKYVHEVTKRDNLPKYDTVRSSFDEGGGLYPDSNFRDRLHIEICVINMELIKGYFLPLPVKEFNPYLHDDFDKDEYLKKRVKNNP